MTEANRPNSDIISALAGGEIEAGEAAAVQAAIDADNDLSDDYQSLLATAELLATAPAARAPRNYASALPPVEIRSRWTRFTPTLLASAAVALIAFALVDLQGSQVGAPDRARAESRTAISAAAPALAESPLAKVQAVEIEPAVVTESRVEAAAAPPAPVAEVRAVEAEIEVAIVAESELAPAAVAEDDLADEPASAAAGAVPAPAEAPLAAEAVPGLQTASADDGAGETEQPVQEPVEEPVEELIEQADDGEAERAKSAPEPAVAAVAAVEPALATAPPTAPRAPPSPTITSLDQLLDPRWFAALVLGGLLLLAAGFAQTFRRP